MERQRFAVPAGVDDDLVVGHRQRALLDKPRDDDDWNTP